MTRIFGGILPYEAEVAEPDGPRIAAWVLADYADRADVIFQKWLAEHDAQVAAKALEDARKALRSLADEWEQRADFNAGHSGEFWQGMVVKGRECASEARASAAALEWSCPL